MSETSSETFNSDRPSSSSDINDDLEDHFIRQNDHKALRFREFDYYCTICEMHLKDEKAIKSHINTIDHCLYSDRFSDKIRLRKAWNNNPPLNSRKLTNFISEIERVCFQQSEKYYQECPRDKLELALSRLEHHVKANLIVDSSSYIDCYVSIKRNDRVEVTISEKMQVIKRYPFKILQHRRYFEDIFNGYCAEWSTFPKSKFFFTFDKKANNSVLASRLISHYMHFCAAVRKLAVVFRSWAWHVLSKRRDELISNVIFDYMVVYFMQRHHGLPIITKEAVGYASLESFLQEKHEIQINKLEPIFREYIRYNWLSTTILFTTMVMYYACEMDYSNVIQITSIRDVQKSTQGIRSIRIMDPITPDLNIFNVTPEMLFNLDNMLFYATWQFLQPLDDSNSVEKLFVTHVHANNWTFKYPYLTFEHSERNHFSRKPLLNLSTLDELAIWSKNSIPRAFVFCLFCHRMYHSIVKCPLLALKYVKKGDINRKIYEPLSHIINKLYCEKRADSMYTNKAFKFIKKLESLISSKTGQDVQLHPFGSLISGFGSNSSDLDLCIKLSGNTVDDEMTGQNLLSSIYEILLQDKRFHNIIYKWKAYVPIVTFNYAKRDCNFEADISYSNLLALENTKLLKTYSDFDARVAPLGMAIKAWAKACKINDASSHTFSSYALIIMLIHFLQRVQPPVLPYLQDKEKFGLKTEIIDNCEVQFYQPKKDYKKMFRKNEMSVGKLFVGFFEYFADFDWNNEVVQIRNSNKMFKLEKDWNQPFVAIEDPFILSRNLSSGIRGSNYLHIQKCFNIMQVMFRKENDCIFANKKFQFDQLDTIMPKFMTRNTCRKCYREGHLQKNCPKLNIHRC